MVKGFKIIYFVFMSINPLTVKWRYPPSSNIFFLSKLNRLFLTWLKITKFYYLASFLELLAKSGISLRPTTNSDLRKPNKKYSAFLRICFPGFPKALYWSQKMHQLLMSTWFKILACLHFHAYVWTNYSFKNKISLSHSKIA